MRRIWSRWCPEGNHSNNKIQPQLTPAYNNSTSSLEEKRHAHFQAINNIYLTLYCPTHEQNEDQSNVTRHTKSKKTGLCQETKNRTKLRDDSDVAVIKEIKITIINILKVLVENMGNMYEQIEISAERWEL